MPGDAYSNPSFVPPVFGYTWSPVKNATGDAIATGFYQARIGRGRFINAIPDLKNDDTTKTRVTATGVFNEDQKYFPIQNVFRPLQSPYYYTSLPPSDFFGIVNKFDGESIEELLSYAVKLPASKRIASLQLEYSFVVDPKDTTFLETVTDEEDKKNIESGDYAKIDLNKYLYLDVLLDGKVYTSTTGDKTAKLLPLTGLSTSSVSITKKLRLETTIPAGLSSGNYPQATEIKLIPNKKIKSLKLDIKKFYIYEASNSCNIDDRNLPSNILSYAVLVDCEVDQGIFSSASWKAPKLFDTRPTINVKVFNPDYRINSPGFSHSVDLRFFGASVPLDSGAAAALGNLGAEGTFNVTLLNVGVGRRQARYVFDGTQLSDGLYKLTEFTLYSKKKSFTLIGSGNNNDKDISDASLGVFIASDQSKPFPINLGTTFTKGTFKTAFDASVNYKDSDANAGNSVSHIYFRFWLVPSDVDTNDVELVRSYRDSTEFIFKVTDGKTVVVKGSPESFLDLLVSPPLDEINQTFEIARFINTQKKLTFDGIDFTTAVLAVEVFVKTISTDGTQFTNFPQITFAANSEVSGIESNIFQNISHTLYPMRSIDIFIFISSIFTPIESPLNLTNVIVGNKKSVSANGYIQYQNKFVSATSSSTVENAFKDLLVMDPVSSSGKINVTLTEQVFKSLKKTSQPTNSSATINVDFVTDGEMLSNGRVNEGAWSIKLTRKNVDKDLSFDLQIQGLMISSDGKVLSRLFKSPLLPDKEEISYTPLINIPFNIESLETQFVLRLSLYPYSSEKYTYEDLKTSATKESLEPGFKFESVKIIKHTLEYLKTTANDDLAGSPGYNEDLPIAPVKVLGNDPEIDGQFFFIASEESLGTKTVTTANPYRVSGTLYSPTWFVNMPEDSEVKFNSAFTGGSSSRILFRSVIGGAQVEDSVSAATNNLDGNITVAYNSNRPDAIEGGEVDLISLSGYSGSYFSYNLRSNQNKSDFYLQSDPVFKGQNPQVINFQPINNSIPNANTMYLLGESSDNSGPFLSVAVNNSGSSQNSWQLPGSEFYQDDQGFNVQKKLVNALTFTSVQIDKLLNTVYTIGYVDGGSLILKTVEAFQASSDNNSGVSTFLVAGPEPSNIEDTNLYPLYKNLQENNTDPVAQTYSCIINFEKSKFVIFYVSQNRNAIKYKILNGLKLSNEATLFDLSVVLGSSSTKNFISGLNSVFDNKLKIIHLIFWCDKKLFTIQFSDFVYSETTMMPQLQMVAGNFEPDQATNQLIYDLKESGYVILNTEDTDNGDIPQQRSSLVFSDISKKRLLMAWYKDTNNKIVSKAIYPNSNVFDKKVYEVYSQ